MYQGRLSCSVFQFLFQCVIILSSFLHVLAIMTVAHQTTIRIPSKIWRAAASQHQERIRNLLRPGLTPLDHPLNAGIRKQYRKANEEWVTALDPKNPVYNFLIEYYGLKGSKGVRKLCRWSPSPGLLMQSQFNNIESVDQLHELSAAYTHESRTHTTTLYESILLEGAGENDFGSTIHLRGATLIDGEGVLYSPAAFYGKGDPSQREDSIRMSSPFLWYHSILQQTLQADPILHCYGLHEWAMQYQPKGAPT